MYKAGALEERECRQTSSPTKLKLTGNYGPIWQGRTLSCVTTEKKEKKESPKEGRSVAWKNMKAEKF